MATQQQLQTLDKYVNAIHEMLMDQINGVRNAPGSRQIKSSRAIYVRMFGQLLYEAPKLHTGLVSIRLVEQKLKDFSSRYCLEHHHSRQRGGDALVALFETAIATGIDPTKKQVRDIALIYCQVHYTTAYENEQLRKHQRKCTSEAAYRRANIQLVEARELFTQKGRHSKEWKQQMREKYGPIVERYNNPVLEEKPLPEMPLVIN